MNDRVLSGNFHTHTYINTQLLPSPSSFDPSVLSADPPPSQKSSTPLPSFTLLRVLSSGDGELRRRSSGVVPFPNIIFFLFLHPSHFSVLLFWQDHGGCGGDGSLWTAASASSPEIAWVFFILLFFSRPSLLIFSFLCLRRVLRFRRSSGKFVGV